MEEGQQRNQKSGQMIDEKGDRCRATFYSEFLEYLMVNGTVSGFCWTCC